MRRNYKNLRCKISSWWWLLFLIKEFCKDFSVRFLSRFCLKLSKENKSYFSFSKSKLIISNNSENQNRDIQQYRAEEIGRDGSSSEFEEEFEEFNFLQPSCPNTDKDGKFASFTCFDYLEDTVMTKEETTTRATTAVPDKAIPKTQIAIFAGLGSAFFLVIIAIVIYKIRKGKWFEAKIKTVKCKIKSLGSLSAIQILQNSKNLQVQPYYFSLVGFVDG